MEEVRRKAFPTRISGQSVLRVRYELLLEMPKQEGLRYESEPDAEDTNLAYVYETIVLRERPALFIQDSTFNTKDVTTYGTEAVERIADQVLPLLSLLDQF